MNTRTVKIEEIEEGVYYCDGKQAAAMAALLQHSPTMAEFVEIIREDGRKLKIKDTRFLSHSSTFLLEAWFSLRGYGYVRLDGMGCLDGANTRAFLAMLEAWKGA